MLSNFVFIINGGNTMLIQIYFFIIGSIVGSFLTLCTDRLAIHQSIISPRSHCFNCQHLLGIYDLIPILSYCLLNGKCRYCKQAFPSNSCFTELALGLLYIKLSTFIHQPLTLIFNLIITTILIYLSIDDLKHTYVNGYLIGILGLLGLLYHPTNITLILFLLLLISVFSSFQYSTIFKGLGEADFELFIVFTILLDLRTLPLILLCSSLTCLIFTLGLQKITPRQIPFIPYLVFGYFLATA
ncbi:hypothetical protein BSQ38_01875 [Pediococcus damnosus]|nr:hypothetical protein BSQ38_01875 [Pediococcus damnosus]